MKGANAGEFESQVNFLIWETYPRASVSSHRPRFITERVTAHPHTQKSIPALDAVSTDPILFTQVPALDAVAAKLSSFIDSGSIPTSASIKQTLTSQVIPYLKARFPSGSKPGPAASPALLEKWTGITRALSTSLAPAQLFPLVDLWRLALLDAAVGSFCASSAGGSADPIQILLVKGLAALSDADQKSVRNYLLVLLRLLCNSFATPALARNLLSGVGKRKGLTALLVGSVLHADALVRTAAASLAFNVSAYVQKERLEQVRKQYGPFAASEEDGDWEVEVVSAILEALQKETQSEDISKWSAKFSMRQFPDGWWCWIVHRLTASLAFMLRFSPVYDAQVRPLVDVLQGKEMLKAKLEKGGFGEEGVKAAPLRKLITQVADHLC